MSLKSILVKKVSEIAGSRWLWSCAEITVMSDDVNVGGRRLKRRTFANLKEWVTLSFRNSIVLHQSVTPNNRFNT